MVKTKTFVERIESVMFYTFVVLGIMLTVFVEFTEKQLGNKPKKWSDLLK